MRRPVLIALLLATFSAHALSQQPGNSPLRIQILSGKTGRPVTGVIVDAMDESVLGTAPVQRIAHGATDGEGFLSLPLNVESRVSQLGVFIAGYRPCAKASHYSFNLSAARGNGIVSENNCKPRITLYPQAGVAVLFVRPETLFERFKEHEAAEK